MLPGPSAGILQLAHPGLGAGVAEHSAFFDEPAERIVRSVPQIWATIFADVDEGDERGGRIRDLHRTMSGLDAHGNRYHALDPDTFWWAHATFTWEIFRSVELFHLRQLCAAERDQLYAETVTWYARYGMSMRPVPDDYAVFRERFDTVCAHELERTAAAVRAFEVMRGILPALPKAVRGAGMANRALTPAGRILVRGALPVAARARLEVAWNRRDAAAMQIVCTTARLAFAGVPAPLNSATMQRTQRAIGAATRPHRRTADTQA